MSQHTIIISHEVLGTLTWKPTNQVVDLLLGDKGLRKGQSVESIESIEFALNRIRESVELSLQSSLAVVVYSLSTHSLLEDPVGLIADLDNHSQQNFEKVKLLVSVNRAVETLNQKSSKSKRNRGSG